MSLSALQFIVSPMTRVPAAASQAIRELGVFLAATRL
jgi:hypothetical protein